MLHSSLDALRPFKQFLLWRLETIEGRERKVPIDPITLKKTSAADPSCWHSVEIAEEAATKHGLGLAFCFDERDPFFFLDIDKAYKDGEWSEIARSACEQFQGAAIELSQSKTGLHIIGTTAPINHKKKNETAGLELYTGKRFVALTGLNAQGDASKNFTPVVKNWVDHFFHNSNIAVDDWSLSDKPCEEWTGPEDDDVLIRKALKSKSNAAFLESKITFEDLWNANQNELEKHFPGINGGYDGNRVDGALARHLSFWTGKHGERIQRLMMRSSLVREKWTERADYLPRTIAFVIANTTKVYDLPPPEEAAQKMVEELGESDRVKIRSGLQYLPPAAQIKHFKGYTYIRDVHRVLTPDGATIEPKQFRVERGGYQFALSSDNSTKPTTDAFKAFTESQVLDFVFAHEEGFDPTKAPDEIYVDDGTVRVNSWRPVHVDSRPGDVTLFLDLLSRLFPNEEDRTIVLSYLSACVQYKGHKFDWAIFIQGVHGNGKTFLTRATARAIGYKYVHMPDASTIGDKHNLWLTKNILIGVEDIYVPHDRVHIIETLKPMITGKDGIGIQPKFVDQKTLKICCNFIFNSNHKDALPISANERRFAIFYTPQQSVEDLALWGMNGEYFPRLYDWFNDEGGAFITHFLENFQIPEKYNPVTKCKRAPLTSSSLQAREASRGPIEQLIQEGIEEELPGFKKGWIAASAVEDLLREKRGSIRLTPKKLAEVICLCGDGYLPHPNLNNGRVDNKVSPGPRRTKLFIVKNHYSLNIGKKADIALRYEIDQGYKEANEGMKVIK